MIMYYVEVVPTDIETFASHIKTYQYSVKENIRKIGEKFCAFVIPPILSVN